MSSSLHLEYEEGLDTLGSVGIVFYKFASAFTIRVRNTEVDVRFGHNIQDQDLPVQVAETFKAYLKEQKEWIREQGKDVLPAEAKRRMWWIVTKMIDLGIFAADEQQIVMAWLNTCLSAM